ncbi:unnamed protein product, partial [Rotaria socialis]
MQNMVEPFNIVHELGVPEEISLKDSTCSN